VNRTAAVAGDAPAQSTAPADRRPAWFFPTSRNVSVDPITGAGRRAGCGYPCGIESATRDSEHARPRHAWSGSGGLGFVVTARVLAALEISASAPSSVGASLFGAPVRALVANGTCAAARGPQTRVHRRTGMASVVPWLVVSRKQQARGCCPRVGPLTAHMEGRSLRRGARKRDVFSLDACPRHDSRMQFYRRSQADPLQVADAALCNRLREPTETREAERGPGAR